MHWWCIQVSYTIFILLTKVPVLATPSSLLESASAVTGRDLLKESASTCRKCIDGEVPTHSYLHKLIYMYIANKLEFYTGTYKNLVAI